MDLVRSFLSSSKAEVEISSKTSFKSLRMCSKSNVDGLEEVSIEDSSGRSIGEKQT